MQSGWFNKIARQPQTFGVLIPRQAKLGFDKDGDNCARTMDNGQWTMDKDFEA
jgi:hypothetical protein